MALRDFWRRIERYGEDRDRDRWRSTGDDWRTGNEWRDEGRFGRSYGQGSYGGYGDYERGEGRRRYGSDIYGGDYGRRDYEYGQDFERGGRYGYGGVSRGAYGYGAGQYRGVGPRGYQRSDERIREDVCERLTEDPEIDASNLEVMVKSGEVTLSGTVSSRDDKRRAEECAEDVSGVKDVHNTLRVSPEWGTGEQKSTQQTTTQTARH